MTSIHLNDIALPKKFEKLPLSYYINVKSESEFSKNFSKIFFFIVISQTYPKMVLRNAILQKFCHHKNDSKPFPSLIGCLGFVKLNVVTLKVSFACTSLDFSELRNVKQNIPKESLTTALPLLLLTPMY